MKNLRTLQSTILVAFALTGLLGCSGVSDQPELGKVSGIVTLDGVPLQGVIVNFQPDTGRASTAETNSSGKYELVYIYGSNGAKVGNNNVSFRWPDGAENAKALPKKYVGKTELNADVKSGRNTFDWPLESSK